MNYIIGLIISFIGLIISLLLSEKSILFLFDPSSYLMVCSPIILVFIIWKKVIKTKNITMLYNLLSHGVFGGTLIGVIFGISFALINSGKNGAIGIGLAIFYVSIIFGLFVSVSIILPLKYNAIIKKQNINITNIKIKKITFFIIGFLIIVAICVISLKLCHIIINYLYYPDDIISYILLLIGITVSSKSYKIFGLIFCEINSDIDKNIIINNLKYLSIGSILLSIIVCMNRFFISLIKFESFKYIFPTIGTALLILVIGLIFSISFFLLYKGIEEGEEV